MIVGVAGHMCAGKDSIGQILEQNGFLHIPLTDVVFKELERSGRKNRSRGDRRKFASDRRKKFGGAYFLKLAVDDVLKEDPNKHCVVTGIYCASEAIAIIEEYGGVLLGIEPVEASVRWNRLRERHDEKRDLLTREEFYEIDEAESSGQHDHEPNIPVVLRLAHHLIDNSSDLVALQREVESVLKDLAVDDHLGETANSELDRMRRVATTSLEFTEPVIDGYVSNMDLERRSRAAGFLRNFYSLSNMSERERVLAPLIKPTHAVTEIGNQFATKLVDAFLEHDPLMARKRFNAIRPSTTDEELALLLNDTEFLRCHEALGRFLAGAEEDLYDAVALNLRQSKDNDDRQFSRVRKRDLDSVLQDGITVLLDPTHVDKVLAARKEVGSGRTPILEVLKQERIFEVSGFGQSKVSLAIHDAIDHGWLFALLERKGLFRKFRALFDSIGNPEAYDIFRREGEAVASIGFGVRYWAETQPGFVPLYSVSDIARTMERHFDEGLIDPIHHDSYVRIRRLARNPSQRESQSLAFVFSNYIVELDEQRRKEGRIKVLNPLSHRIDGELDPWSPDYLSFFIETHRELLDSHNKHRDNLLRAHILVEEFLCSESVLGGKLLRIPVGQLEELDVADTELPEKRISWMARHYGFTAFKEPLL